MRAASTTRPGPSWARRRAGQSLVESSLVIILLCFLLLGALQVSQLYAARQVTDQAASLTARARAVGLNDFMVYKAGRVATIPNAGRITTPNYQNTSGGPTPWGQWRLGALVDDMISDRVKGSPQSAQFAIERSRIPLYLGAESYGQLGAILDYADWDTFAGTGLVDFGGDSVLSNVRQDFQLRFPMHRAFYADDEVRLQSRAEMDSHYSLYLE